MAAPAWVLPRLAGAGVPARIAAFSHKTGFFAFYAATMPFLRKTNAQDARKGVWSMFWSSVRPMRQNVRLRLDWTAQDWTPRPPPRRQSPGGRKGRRAGTTLSLDGSSCRWSWSSGSVPDDCPAAVSATSFQSSRRRGTSSGNGLRCDESVTLKPFQSSRRRGMSSVGSPVRLRR